MTASHDIPTSSDLVAGPRPATSAPGAKLGALDRFGTPLWIAVGLLVIALAVIAALG
jgi:hypothetical protein